MKIDDVMAPLVESVHPDDTLRDAVEKMKALDIDPMPVTEDGRLVGVLAGEAVEQRAAQAGLSAGSIRVKEVMSAEFSCCMANDNLEEAAERFIHQPDGRRFTRLPVVDADRHLVGSISADVLRKHLTEEEPGEGVAAAFAVESISSLLDFDEDRVDYMSDESFPASDPIPPPSTLGPDEIEQG